MLGIFGRDSSGTTINTCVKLAHLSNAKDIVIMFYVSSQILRFGRWDTLWFNTSTFCLHVLLYVVMLPSWGNQDWPILAINPLWLLSQTNCLKSSRSHVGSARHQAFEMAVSVKEFWVHLSLSASDGRDAIWLVSSRVSPQPRLAKYFPPNLS